MNYKLDPTASMPLHEQAELILRKLVEQDEYKKGALLPSEVDLSQQLGISRNTLRQAINKLVFEGLLIRKKGFGTKVAGKSVLGGVKNWLSFSQEMKMLGIAIKNYELHVTLKKVNENITRFFGSEAETPCLTLERVRGTTDSPFVYFISYFNPKIPMDCQQNFNKPLYEILEKEFQIVVKTSKEEISAALAGDFIAEKLNIMRDDPILIRKRFVYDVNDEPTEYNIGYYRADSFTYTIEAQR